MNWGGSGRSKMVFVFVCGDKRCFCVIWGAMYDDKIGVVAT